eukprot:scaffold1328_cov394-Prasinococcus_capsulatus_cf.AAC.16
MSRQKRLTGEGPAAAVATGLGQTPAPASTSMSPERHPGASPNDVTPAKAHDVLPHVAVKYMMYFGYHWDRGAAPPASVRGTRGDVGARPRPRHCLHDHLHQHHRYHRLRSQATSGGRAPPACESAAAGRASAGPLPPNRDRAGQLGATPRPTWHAGTRAVRPLVSPSRWRCARVRVARIARGASSRPQLAACTCTACTL